MPRIFVNERNQYFVTKRAGLLTSYDYNSGVYGSFGQLEEAKVYACAITDGLNYVHIMDAAGQVVCSYNTKGDIVIDKSKSENLQFYP